MAGVDFPAVKELMAHKDIMMTLRYTYPTSDHKQCAVRTLERVEDKVPAIFTIARARDAAMLHKHLLFKAGPLAQLAEQRTLNP